MPITSTPARRGDVELIQLGHEGVLYDPVAVRVHRLNPTGLLVWQCCDGTAAAPTIVDELADAFDEPTEVVATAVDALIAELAELGLLVGTGSPRPPRDRRPDPDAQAPPTPRFRRRLGPYAIWDLQVTIECHDAPEVADEIERMLVCLAVDPTAPRVANAIASVVWRQQGGWTLDAGGTRLTAPDESTVCDFVLWELTRMAIERSSRYLVIHASAVSRDGVAVVFPAEADSGKSTLAAMLVEAGFDYLTDEATAIDLDTGEVVAYPKPITLDPGSQELLAHLDPGGLTGDGAKWRLVPTDIRPGCVVERAVLGHLVIPTHEPGADNVLADARTIDAVVAVAAAAYNLAQHGHRLDDIVELVDHCTHHTLRHDGVAGPIAAIEALVSGATA